MRIIGISHREARSPEQPGARPASILEADLALIWQDVLGQVGIGSTDHFFELGGNSLGVVRVAARIEQRLGVRMPLSTLFRTPTLAGMATELAAALQQATGSALPPLEPSGESGLAPLSVSQERMWLLHQLDANGTAYSVAGAMRLEGLFSPEAAEHSLRLIVERHEALRTVFVTADGQLAQAILPADFTLERFDLHATGLEAREAEAAEQMRAAVGRPFDFQHGPMFRASLFQLGEDHHLLLLDLPHVNSDAWSMGVLTQEFFEGYRARLEGVAPVLPDLPVQYRDYARWQRSWLQGEVLEQLRAYWWPKMQGLAPLNLPLDFPRPPTLTFAGATVSCPFPPPLLAGLRRLAVQEDATLFMVLLTAFKVLLLRWTGTEDVAVGTPVAGRQTQGAEGLIGVFVNTLVMRTDLGARPTFREALGRVKETAVGAFSHQDMPFAQLVADLQSTRDLSRSPMVQVMFNQINVPMPSRLLPGLKVSFVELDRGGAQFDLSCTVTEIEGEERLTLEYNTALFGHATIETLLERFVRLLEGVTETPDADLWSLPLISESERRQLLARSGQAEPGEPEGKSTREEETVHGLFEAQVRRTPDAPALRFGAEQTRYRDLNARANRLARRLLTLGVQPGHRVAVCLPRSPEAVTAILAVLKAGGSYVPLDPAQPPTRLALLLEDAQPTVLVTHRSLSGRLPAGTMPTLYLDDSRSGVLADDFLAGDLDLPGVPEQAAYLLYTSGTTGTPKGVTGLHRGVLYRLTWMWRAYPFREGEVCCHKTSFSFVDSVWELFGPLLAGIPVVLVPDEVVKDPPALIDLLAREQISRLVLVPSLLRVLLEALPPGTDRLPRLWLWSSSGEALSTELAAQFRRSVPQATLLNLYGSTEVAGDATWAEVTAPAGETREGRTFAPVGRPIPGARVYVVDPQLGLVPPGTPGELLIGGLGLAQGYHRKPDLTAERFLQNPFGSGRVFRTHDRAVWQPDGTLMLLGRTDRQVKVRGVRVEPEEIEALLLQHPQVRQCAVVLVPRQDPELAAYVVPSGPVDAAELRAYLAERVAAPSVPAFFELLGDLPHTSSGKLDRQHLPQIQHPTPAGHIPPGTPEEERMVALWSEVLQRPTASVGLHDSFFDLGGHSLLAARLIARIELTFGVRVPLAALFRGPTVAALCRYLDTPGQQNHASLLVAFNPQGQRPPLFCLPGIGGHMTSMRDLARVLGPDAPVYGLEAVGVGGHEAPLGSVEEMAERYLGEVRKVQPHGPYYLCGHSFGGLIAYELAGRLQAAGEEVGLLVLLDTWTPRPAQLSATLLSRALRRQVDTEVQGLARPGAYLRKSAKRIRTAFRLLAQRGADPSELDFPSWFRAVRRSNLGAAARYRAGRLDVQALLVRAEQRKLIEPLFAWEDLLQRPFEVATVGGTHVTMVETAHIQAVGQIVAAHLLSAQRRPSRAARPTDQE